MEACIVICRTFKPSERRGKVLFINAVDEVTRERSMSFLKPEHQERIADAYHAFIDVPGFARVGTVEEIRINDGNLSVNGTKAIGAMFSPRKYGSRKTKLKCITRLTHDPDPF